MIAAGVLWAWWLRARALLRAPPPAACPSGWRSAGRFLRLMQLTSRVADRFGRRDWVENAAVKVYNALALMRQRKVGKGELLLLIPRCLSKETLDGVLGIAGKYGVPVFVATRGQLARRVIRERRPRAVVAVACERDMVSGLHDVAGKVPVLGLTMTLPGGPLQGRAGSISAQLEEWVGRTWCRPLVRYSASLGAPGRGLGLWRRRAAAVAFSAISSSIARDLLLPPG